VGKGEISKKGREEKSSVRSFITVNHGKRGIDYASSNHEEGRREEKEKTERERVRKGRWACFDNCFPGYLQKIRE